MSLLEEVLEFNHHFVESKQYEDYYASKYPRKRVAIVACMDTRLVELLPKALNMKNGDAVLIKVAGGQVVDSFDSVLKSLLVSIYELHVEEIMIIGHHNCGAQHLSPDSIMAEIAVECGGIDPTDQRLKAMLTGFGDLEKSVQESVVLVKNHPFIPERITVHGLLMDPETGKLEVVETGNQVKQLHKEAAAVY